MAEPQNVSGLLRAIGRLAALIDDIIISWSGYLINITKSLIFTKTLTIKLVLLRKSLGSVLRFQGLITLSSRLKKYLSDERLFLSGSLRLVLRLLRIKPTGNLVFISTLSKWFHASNHVSGILRTTSTLLRRINIGKEVSGKILFSSTLAVILGFIRYFRNVSGPARFSGRIGSVIDDIVIYWEGFREILQGPLRFTGTLYKRMWLQKRPTGILRFRGLLARKRQHHRIFYPDLRFTGLLTVTEYFYQKLHFGTLRIVSTLARKYRTLERPTGKLIITSALRLAGMRFRHTSSLRFAGDVSVLREVMYYGVANP